MKRQHPRLPGPLYDSWDDAMSDPNFDLSRPWFIADPDVPADQPPARDTAPSEWPAGWAETEAVDLT